MFTGLVQTLGTLSGVVPTTEFAGYSFTISEAESILGDCSVGDSIAVNGVCLTVTAFDAKAGSFCVNLANETLDRSNLGSLRPFPVLDRRHRADLGRIVTIDRRVEARRSRQPGASAVWRRSIRRPLCPGEPP